MAYHRGCGFSLCWACAGLFSLTLTQGPLGWLGSGALLRGGKMLMSRGWFLSQFAVSEGTGRHDATDMAECLAWFPCFCLKPLWGVASISHIFMWVDNSLDYRNWLIKLVCGQSWGGTVRFGSRCQGWLHKVWTLEFFLEANVTWSCCPGLLFLNCHWLNLDKVENHSQILPPLWVRLGYYRWFS